MYHTRCYQEELAFFHPERPGGLSLPAETGADYGSILQIFGLK
jgi:hypothetical protein